MKIGTITVQGGINYGASLQAYALVHALRGLGVEAGLINYKNPRIVRIRDNMTIKWKKPSSKSAVINDAVYLFNRMTGNHYLDRHKKFDDFECKLFMADVPTCYSSTDLDKLNDIFDGFICGSDQIWNSQITEHDNAYFLDFADESKLKIAYAPSFGKRLEIDNLGDDEKEWIQKGLSHINVLSVREKSNRSIVEKLSGRNCEVVLDPTLLLTQDQWKQLADSSEYHIPEEPYAFIYQIFRDDTLMKYAVQRAKEKGMRVVCVTEGPFKALLDGCKSLKNQPVGPAEFVKLILHAKFVVTSSFHGMVFSAMFNKPFWADVIHGEKADRSMRLVDLAETLGLKHHFISYEKKNYVYPQTNWETVNAILNRERDKSLKYLVNALSGFNNSNPRK